ncbi:rhodanese-like domain-containing protein [Rhizosphaericola mali]|uniref:Rhodanese-like domain-containing protein n=1 Tax=Rhizosphaericola mali TaxID=2545455 RepID=A0A5P2G2H9_9BACT|nr:rhodanese-like domain-containing protein [Rhizosphaericola mali]QES87303.1 rhodanese-like domain-containing protein [Rhizosphaericola mali]
MNSITIEELKAKLDNGEEVNLLDVREPDEHEEFNIGGRLVPLGEIRMMALDDIEDWQNEEIVVYCRSGNRSGQASLILEQAGYSPVNLTGGMLAWQEKYAQ